MSAIIIYGSTTGTTEGVAAQIGGALGGAEILGVSDLNQEALEGKNLIILGTSTWGMGDLQDDWEEALSTLKDLDFSGKKVALFGLGDQEGYPDTYVDGMGILYDKLLAKGVTVIGSWPSSGYSFDESTALRDGHFVGLALDEDNQGDQTPSRIEAWVKTLL